MEFDKDKPVSDEERRLAEAKKVTVRPIHADITPDDLADSAIASSHINGQPIGNAPTDIEQAAQPVRHIAMPNDPDPKVKKQAIALVLVTVISAGLVIALSLYFVLR